MSWDPTWEQIFATRRWGTYPPEDLIRFMGRRFYDVEDRSAVRVLEIGCGAGANVWYLAREGFSVAAVDGAPSAIAQAAALLDAEGLSAELVVGDMLDIGEHWPSSSFDAVVDVACLFQNRIAAVDRALGAVQEVLRPGGWLFSSLLSTGSYGEGLGTEVEPGTFVDISDGPLAGRGLVHFFTRDEIDRLFGRFDSVQVDHLERSLDGGPEVHRLWHVVGRRPPG